MSYRETGALTASAILALSIGLAAEQRQEQVFRSGAELTRVEVSVLDRRRVPVRSLSPADFVLEVDGVQQEIVFLEEVSSEVTLDGRTVRSAAVGSSNDLTDARLFVIVMDDAQAPFEPFVAKVARDTAVAFVRGLRPTDRVSVVYTWDIHKGQEFTHNHQHVIEAIQRFQPVDAYAPFASLYAERTLEGVVQSLYALQGFRRAVLLLSPGVRGGSQEVVTAFGPFDESIRMDWPFQGDNILRTTGRGNRVRIPIYSVDVRGLVAPKGSPSGLVWPSSAGTDWLKTISNSSGGVAVTNTNDPLPSIRRILVENASYYVLGYQPVSRDQRGTIRLRVRRSDALTLVRQYLSPGGEVPTPESAARALDGVLPSRAVPVKMLARTFPTANSSSELVVGVGVGFPPGDKTAASELDVEWKVFDEGPRVRVQESRRFVPPELMRSPRDATFFLRSRLPPGRYHVRVSVKGSSWRSPASVFGDVVVPEVGLKPAVSNVVLWSRAAPVLSPVQVRDLIPHVPSLTNVFAAGGEIDAWVTLLVPTAALAATVLTELIDERGLVIHSDTADVVASCRAMCGHKVSLPAGILRPGRHYLRVTLRTDTASSVSETPLLINR